MTQTANPSTPLAEESTQVEAQPAPDYSVYLEYVNGKLFLGNSIGWLRSLEAESIDLIFADPPYNLNKAFTVKLNPLDGIYYCDIRPNMQQDKFLARHIKTIDHFLCSDVWNFLENAGLPLSEVVVEEKPQP